MLELCPGTENTWIPPHISEQEEENMICPEYEENFVIFHTEPYIDAYYIYRDEEEENPTTYMKRFSFHEGFRWSYEEEELFDELCRHNDRIYVNSDQMDSVFKYYSEKYPDWKLKRYYTKPMWMLDHIYHCMRRDSAKEMLYKAGLDELAANVNMLEEINLMASKPSDIYDGVTMRALRALNCKTGAELLADREKRKVIKELQVKFPKTFDGKLNDSQCKYLCHLIDGQLTVPEVGRLFGARKQHLRGMWAPGQYQMFIQRETEMSDVKQLASIDPIYRDFIEKRRSDSNLFEQKKMLLLKHYLLRKREEYDIRFRRSNRKRNADWEERNHGYVVRYPQTINDFCREAIYMSNCLMTYVDAYLHNDTTVLFMRKTDDVNTPFITIEIFHNNLAQAYHRFNVELSEEEENWIFDYCRRHGIYGANIRFDD